MLQCCCPPCVAEGASGAGLRAPQEGQAPAAAAGPAGADLAAEAAELRHHCVVLEQLLAWDAYVITVAESIQSK